MTEHSKLIAYIEQKVREAENRDMISSWLVMSREEVIDFLLRDWFAERGLLRHKP